MWTINDRVLAKPGSEPYWYPGIIRHAEHARCYVILDNGEDGWFGHSELKSFEVPVGSEVMLQGADNSSPCSVTIERLEAGGPVVRDKSGEAFVAGWGSIQIPANSLTSKPRQKKIWSTGERVFARWGGDLFWYPGTIFARETTGYLIVFDDQDKAVVSTDDILPLSVEIEDRVFCRPKFEPLLRYFPAEITRIDGEIIDVRYDEPESEEQNTNVSRIRIRRESGSQVFWEEGKHVLASGRDEYWLPAIVLAVDGERTFVSLLDGRHGWLKPEEIRPLKIIPGMNVECRQGAAAEYIPAMVEEVRGNVIEVTYQDNARETTLLSLLRIPAS